MTSRRMSYEANSGSDAADQSVPCDTPSCPFWGLQSTMNLCSQCYKERIKQDQQKQMAQVNKPEPVTEQEADIPKLNSSKGASVTPEESSPAQVLSGPSRPSVEAESEKSEKLDNEETLSAPVPVTKVVEVPKKVQKDRRRCLECNKFLGFTGIKCKCGFVFCGSHRYPENHDCDFDFDGFARKKFLQNRTEAAVADKISGERL